jgi:AcrR family transcriptional regulator
MGVSERKEREKEQRRNAIIDVAEHIFFEKGFEQSSMDEIAVAAELGKGTLYLYFPRKTDLLFAIHLRGLEILFSAMQTELPKGNNGLEKLRRMADAFFRYTVDHANYFHFDMILEKMLISNDALSSEYNTLCQQRGDDIFELVIQAIDLGKTDGSIRSDHTSIHLATLLWAGSRGILELYYLKKKQPFANIIDKSGLSAEMLIPSFFNLLMAGIQSQDVPAPPKTSAFQPSVLL